MSKMSKIKNGGLDQYVAGPFEQQQFGTAVVEGVNMSDSSTKQLDRMRIDIKASQLCRILLYYHIVL